MREPDAAPDAAESIHLASCSAWYDRFSPALLLLILLLGFGIRFTGLKWGQAYSYFGQGDAVEAYQVAVNYGHGEAKAQYLGQPNYNYHSKLPGPFWTIFCFEACRFWGSVEGIALTIIVLNTAVIALVYVVTRMMMGPRLALLAALFTATFPWVVYYSNGVYNPDVMAFLSALLLLALWRTVQCDRAPVVFCVPILLLILPQFHMSGLLLIPTVITILWLSPRRFNWTLLGLGSAAAVCLYLPYVRGDMAHGWQNTRMMFTSQGSGRGYSFESLKAITAPLSFLVNWGPRWTRDAAEYRELGRACFGSFAVLLLFNIFSMVFAGSMILGAILEMRKELSGFWRAPRQILARSPGIAVPTIFFVVPLLLATIAGQPFHTRYCVVLLPALLPLCALGAARWLGSPGKIATIVKALMVVTCCANVWLMPAMYFHQGKQIENSVVFVPSFRQLETVYHSLKACAGTNSPVDVVDRDYLNNARGSADRRRDAALIRRYVSIRELDSPNPHDRAAAKVFELRTAEAAATDSNTLGYKGHGIELLARP
jgi:hypothetical protein